MKSRRAKGQEEEGGEGISLTLRRIECPEDEDFMSEFDRMLADNLLERTRETPRPPAHHSHISVPVHVKSSAKKTYGTFFTFNPLPLDEVSTLRPHEEEKKVAKIENFPFMLP